MEYAEPRETTLVTTGITFREKTLKKLVWIRLRKIPNSDVGIFVPGVINCSPEPLFGCSRLLSWPKNNPKPNNLIRGAYGCSEQSPPGKFSEVYKLDLSMAARIGSFDKQGSRGAGWSCGHALRLPAHGQWVRN